MVDVQTRPIEHFKFIHQGLAWIDRVHWVSVHVRRDVQAVPMRNGGFIQFVVQIDSNFLAFM